MAEAEKIGRSGSLELGKQELLTFLADLPLEIRGRARTALGDISGACYCAYDLGAQRAYCFQRNRLKFVFQYWGGIETVEVAEKLFAIIPTGQLPLPVEGAERIYRIAVAK